MCEYCIEAYYDMKDSYEEVYLSQFDEKDLSNSEVSFLNSRRENIEIENVFADYQFFGETDNQPIF